GPEIDVFDREKVFIEKSLERIRRNFPELPIVFEHITTRDAADYVRAANANLAATITPHHLLINRNAMFLGGIRPHHYCLPVAKRELHRLALREAATSGDHRFFLGTDSAPHLAQFKESACGCAGIFNVANTMAILAQVFEQEGQLDNLEKFASINGPKFYNLAVNSGTMVLSRSDTALALPADVKTAAGDIKIFDPQMPVHWQVSAINR
ncbi:MAG: amidohydrolase family protein, partial [Pseudomonadales bacterium]|nr:amidohydrolase family protein [Pseudomonadales bacterium]